MKKAHLPSKLCPVCGLPFTWRRRWAACWDEVKYCSERCRRHSGPHRRALSEAARRQG